MRALLCDSCGSTELRVVDGFAICDYCRSRFVTNSEDLPAKQTQVTVSTDVQLLLEKCVSDPANRRRYANLILDIDPFNTEVHKYLK